MLRRLSLLFVGLLVAVASSAQGVLMEQDVNKDTIPDETGPNLKKFNHTYLGFGLVVGAAETDGSAINYGRSQQFTIGIRVKRKLSNTFAVGWDISFRGNTHNIKQDSLLKSFADSTVHKKEMFIENAVQLQAYLRINFGKRGNHVGNFIDLGGYGQYGLSFRHYYRDEVDPAIYGGESLEVTLKKLAYTQPLNYGLAFRAGSNRYMLFGQYRLSDIFDPDYVVDYAEFPRLIVGLQIGMY